MNPFLSKFYSVTSFLLSKKIKRKIVVIESDDWGSVRMPNYSTYIKCLNNGYPVDKNIYTKYDCLESDDDLIELFNVLSKFKDSELNNPIITANYLVTNPNFNKIIDCGFDDYFYENIKETFSNSKDSKNSLSLVKSGIDSKVFLPQFHGREHLNVRRLMDDLTADNGTAKFAISNHMPGLMFKDKPELGNEYVVALEHKNVTDLEDKKLIIKEGLELFDEIFGFRSKSSIACNYVWHPLLEDTLASNGIEYIQGSKLQFIPKGDYNGFKVKMHYTGQLNQNKQFFLVRNAHFEPVNNGEHALKNCLKQVENAFRFKQAAIISTHRINYVSRMSLKNRENGLKYLELLLYNIIKKWPDVLFMTSVELGDLLKNTRNE